MPAFFYDSDAALAQYLLFHYGTPEQVCPLSPEARAACGFPVRCVTETLAQLELSGRARALDLGCAVGRSSLELRRTFDEVLGIDFSVRFIEAASRMQQRREVEIEVPREGAASDDFRLTLPAGLATDHVTFEPGDACGLRRDLGTFDLVLMANLLDRLPDPLSCLARLPRLVRPGGWLVITSPYTWLEEYTPREKWLDGGGRGTFPALRDILSPSFAFHRALDLPFLIREHQRKFQWGIAEASLWRKR
jgi:putative 4-mercaptohistidine N1-methyltranferase